MAKFDLATSISAKAYEDVEVGPGSLSFAEK